MYKSFWAYKKAYRILGDVVLVSIKKFNVKKFSALKTKKKRKFLQGSLSRALVIRTKVNYVVALVFLLSLMKTL